MSKISIKIDLGELGVLETDFEMTQMALLIYSQDTESFRDILGNAFRRLVAGNESKIHAALMHTQSPDAQTNTNEA